MMNVRVTTNRAQMHVLCCLVYASPIEVLTQMH